MKNNKGFTLIELCVVITIICILVAIGTGVARRLGTNQEEAYPEEYRDPEQERTDQLRRQNDLLEEQIRLKKIELEQKKP